MIRTVGASFASPYVGLFLLWFRTSLFALGVPPTRIEIPTIPLPAVLNAPSLKSIIEMATFLGTVVFVFSALLVLGLKRMNVHGRRSAMICGGLVGAGLLTAWAVFIELPWSGEGLRWLVPLWIDGGLSGAICGWIYWAIATGGQSKSTPP
jgi:hypothetical protein